MINEYELVFIVKDEKEDTPKKVRDYLAQLNGTVIKEDSWGKKKFAYRIKKISDGVYYIWRLKLSQIEMPEFKKKLDFEEGIIRYIIYKLKEK